MSESMESFSPEELESLTIETEAMEGIAEEIEEESVESLEDLEFSSESGSMEGQEALPLVILGKVTAKYLLKVLIKLALKLITRIASNATLRKRVVDAVTKGGRPVFCRLLCQALARSVPPYLRPLVTRLCPIVCRKVAPIAARKLGFAF